MSYLPSLSACVLAVASYATTAWGAVPGDDPPSLLFILTDQQNPRMFGIDANGHGGVNSSLTPNLDQLAARGVHFPRTYCTSPQCVPARLSLLTGRYAHHHGLLANGVWEPAVGELTLPALARRFGYVTANIGKHHMSWLDQRPSPTDHGFDTIVDKDDYRDFCANGGVPAWNQPGNYWSMADTQMGPVGFTFNSNEFHPSGYFADQAIDFLEERAGSGTNDAPFALWLSFESPHTPILPTGPASPQDWAHRYHPWDTLDLPPNFDKVADTSRLAQVQLQFSHVSADEHRQVLSYDYGLVTQVDFNIGRVLSRLDELELADDTIVVFTPDHGDFATEMAAWTKAGGAYECLTRVTTVVSLPGALPEGEVFEGLVSHVDLFPTLVELMGLTPTQREWDRIDGRSVLAPTLAEQTPKDWRKAAFTQFGHPDKKSKLHRAIVTRVDKYNLDENAGVEEEYFDLALDPWEEDNKIADPAYQGRIAKLRARLAKWWGTPEDRAPVYAQSGDESSPPAAARDPFPGPGATDVPRDVDLRWVPTTAAETQRVFLGTDPTNLPLVAELGPMEDLYNPGTLDQGTAYSWRIDGVNLNGVTRGLLWTFATIAQGPGGPGLAHTGQPTDGADDVPQSSALTWAAGSGAIHHDVWFARLDEPLVKVADDLIDTSFAPSGIEAGASYRWRVDSEDAAGGVTVGDEWVFTVSQVGLPRRAHSPAPGHLATRVSMRLGDGLTWSAGAGTLEHDVYFGTTNPPPFRGRRADAFYPTGPLAIGETYYWRIDEVNAAGIRTGFTWRFQADG